MNIKQPLKVNWRTVVIKELLKKTNGHCAYCPKRLLTLEEMTIDHIIPRGKGGLDIIDNMILSCEECNGKKADKLL